MHRRALGRFALSILVLLVSLPAAAAISYGTPTFPATGVEPMAIAVADFNGDCSEVARASGRLVWACT